MVGRDDQKERLLEYLTITYPDEHKVIPIVGMGGIAQQKGNFAGPLYSTIKMDDTVKTKGEAELADMLQKSLKRKRYLIVLDDIWSCEVWDGVRRCFPTEDNAGSRILLTTPNNEVACYAGTTNVSMQMNFMDQDESWNLFKSAAFSNEALSSEFETIGKKIAEKCHGLPLTIVMVAGLLKSKRAIEDWKSVAKDVTDLKTCLLHFGIFPEDSEIPVKNLMRSWKAEGFLKLENDFEGEAEKCLQDLVDRCLVLISKKSLDGTKIRSCKVHDLIYDLCVREIQRKNIFIMNDIVLGISDSGWQYLSMQKMQPFQRVTGDDISYCPYGLYRALLTPVHRQLRDHDNNDLLKQTRSIFYFCLQDSYYYILKAELIHFKLLKVLELRHSQIDKFPLEILSLIWLRYLALLFRGKKFDIPPEICRLWNLQTFIVRGRGRSALITFPEEIWGLMQLRHLKLPEFYLPNPPSVSADKGSHMGFSTIQTISYLSQRCCTKEVIMGIQNVKELGISGYEFDSNTLLNNLVHLQQLETLSLTYCYSRFFPSSAKTFLATLKKLKLKKTGLSWSYLDIIAELPNLEVLKLMDGACFGKEWYPNVRGFT
ncbi:hypothetical protein CQW23_06743 [Capsicum baccatum]|uniref:Uncharacterized protein n=1 Tax=Capsicum baccatum TaxID=33114 RepID=A0A2G2X488_CAPBA|nr:hypothetical protein CQW23_06743 [Capsicum baccatum]